MHRPAVAVTPLILLLLALPVFGAPPGLPEPRASASAQASAAALEPAAEGALLQVLLQGPERSAWDKLDSDTARAEFVEAFWRAHDPTPGTPANEWRTIFRRRALQARQLFQDEGIAWYRTDRARVLLVYGLPDEQELRTPPAVPETEVVWRYQRREQPIRFVAEGQAFRLAADVKLDPAAFQQNSTAELRSLLASSPGGSGQSVVAPAGKAPAAAPAPDVAPEVKIWMQMISTGAMRSDLDLRDRVLFFPAKEGTYTVLGFRIGKDKLQFVEPEPTAQPEKAPEPAAEVASASSAGAAQTPVEATATSQAVKGEEVATAHLRVFGAWLQGKPGSENTIHRFLLPLEVRADEGSDVEAALRTLVVTLLPGTYRLAWGVYDETSGLAVTRDTTVQVPDFTTPGLQLSSIVLAPPPHRPDPTPIRTDKVYPGVRLGGMLMNDDMDHVYARDQVLEVVVMVTGWASDPNVPGKPRLEVEYRVLQGKRGLARLPMQTLDFYVMGQQIPLGQINRLQPGGEYQIQVRVRDLVSEQEITGLVPFSIAPSPEHP